jgi:hypothetical protein
MANGKDIYQLVTPLDKLPVVRDFMLSDKEFRPNTKNSLMGDSPDPVKHQNIQDSLNELQQELADFKKHFEDNPNTTLTNPFFGELNFEQWTHLLHKHAIHHLKQFGVQV